jgi:hypothetical protein
MIFQEEKKAAILDAIRRVIANPNNADRVAAAIAKDWQPLIKIDSQGKQSFPSLMETPHGPR